MPNGGSWSEESDGDWLRADSRGQRKKHTRVYDIAQRSREPWRDQRSPTRPPPSRAARREEAWEKEQPSPERRQAAWWCTHCGTPRNNPSLASCRSCLRRRDFPLAQLGQVPAQKGSLGGKKGKDKGTEKDDPRHAKPKVPPALQALAAELRDRKDKPDEDEDAPEQDTEMGMDEPEERPSATEGESRVMKKLFQMGLAEAAEDIAIKDQELEKGRADPKPTNSEEDLGRGRCTPEDVQEGHGQQGCRGPASMFAEAQELLAKASEDRVRSLEVKPLDEQRQLAPAQSAQSCADIGTRLQAALPWAGANLPDFEQSYEESVEMARKSGQREPRRQDFLWSSLSAHLIAILPSIVNGQAGPPQANQQQATQVESLRGTPPGAASAVPPPARAPEGSGKGRSPEPPPRRDHSCSRGPDSEERHERGREDP